MSPATVHIAGYQLTDVIHKGIHTILYRGHRQADQQPIVLKVLKADAPSLEAITHIKQEFQIRQGLDIAGIVRCYSLETHFNRLLLVLEDFGGTSLKQLLASQSLNLRSFLNIAIQLTDALGALHKHHIIHRDIKPAHLIINPVTGLVKITDFSIASRLSHETQPISSPESLEGTLAYMSPEQTGRMNRSLDYRSDFYSLGVTFYEMLTGKLPFESNDLLELVHCHIARLPVAPHQINADIPLTVSRLVMKLLAKNAEERYQSAEGLKADLEKCLTQWQTRGAIANFTPGQLDSSGQLCIPQKLYGRQQEVAQLQDAFERIAAGEMKRGGEGELGVPSGDKGARGRGEEDICQSPLASAQSKIQVALEAHLWCDSKSRIEMILVSGYSGIGKTSLVNEVHKPLVRQRGYFIAGKFDQFKRDIPYAALIQAFEELMRLLLTESATKLQAWREKLLTALGPNGQVIIDVISEVELIIGKQPEVPELAPIEAQNRFNRVFKQFIQVFTQKEHPLVIFLDDLQWADSASLKLMKWLITDPDSQYLLLIGAYRDNEVSPTHPLMQTVEEIQKAGTVVTNIVLQPLDLTHVTQLIADTLNETAGVDLLAEVLFNKTGGNPFFLTQILSTLYQENLLKFDFSHGKWQWSIEEIQAIAITDKSVVELMADQIQKLPEATQQVLKLAACIGDRFTLEVLSIVNEQSPSATANQLWNALQSGLILPLNNAYKIPLVFNEEEVTTEELTQSKIQKIKSKTADVGYRFLHDRVQQAAYSLIPEEQKKATHLKIGSLVLKNTPIEQLEENIFDIVNQLNGSIDSTIEQGEKVKLAHLNLIAGRKAKASAAYELAFRYLLFGTKLLNSDSWISQYALTLSLYESAAEAAYLSTDFEQMKRLAEVVRTKAKSLLDKVNVYEVEISACIGQNRQLEAIEMGLQVLKLLGVRLNKSPSQSDIQLGLEETLSLLLGKPIEDLIDLPPMTEPTKLAAMRILSSLTPAVFVAIPQLMPLIAFKMVDLSVKYGNTELSTHAYANYGLILCGIVGDIDSGYQFGQLASKLLSRLNTKVLKAKIFQTVNAHVRHWKEHLRNTLKPLLEGYQTGLETGTLEFSGYCSLSYCSSSYYLGKELAVLEREMDSFCESIIRLKLETVINYNNMFRQAISNLRDITVNPCHLIGEFYDELNVLPLHHQANDRTGICRLYINKLILCYLFGEYHQSIENAAIAEKHLDGVLGLIDVPVFYFYDSLVRLAVFPDSGIIERKQILDKVQSNQEKMKKWAHHAPMNHLHKFYLVEAERYRIQGNYVKAMEYYDEAISGAVENEYIQEEALANELAGKFYLSLGRLKIAKTYFIDAQDGYQRWGATAKVKDLASKYPQWFKLGSESAKTESIEIQTLTASSLTGKGGSSALDLATVMKAAQAISSEMVLDKLLTKLMKILLENAGAQKGVFILEQDNQLVIEASSAIEQDEVAVRQSIPVETSGLLPVSVVNYVARSLEDVVLSDAAHEGRFTTDPYIIQHQPLSILCTPIRGQGQLIGILYLENNLTNSAFTSERLEVLRMLCCQAAIALQNAQAHEQLEEYSRTLEQKVEERTQELQQEISDRQRVEEALRLTQFAVDRSVDAITWIASDSRFVYVNDAACNLMDYTREELLISSVCDLLKAAALRYRNPDFCPERWQKHWQELKQHGSLVFETRLKAKNGKLIPIEVSSNYVEVDGQGYICAFSRDITARKQAEKALRCSEVKFRNWFENSQVGIFRTRISDGLILDANQRYIEMTGYDRAVDVIGQKSIVEFYVNLDDRQRILNQIQQEGEVSNFEMQYRRRNGTMHWGLFSVRLNAEENCLEGVITDISDRKQTEKPFNAAK